MLTIAGVFIKTMVGSFIKWLGSLLTWLVDHPIVLSLLIGVAVGGGASWWYQSSKYGKMITGIHQTYAKVEADRKAGVDKARTNSEKASGEVSDVKEERIRIAEANAALAVSDYKKRLAEERARWAKERAALLAAGGTPVPGDTPPGECKLSTSFVGTVNSLAEIYQ
jgi:hypothetical protein